MASERGLTAAVWIGLPEQAVTVDFDTGSSESWVDPPCTPMEGAGAYEDLCRTMGVYIPQQSDTSIQVNGSCPPAWISYGSGAAFVRYYRDVINFGGKSENLKGEGGRYTDLVRPF